MAFLIRPFFLLVSVTYTLKGMPGAYLAESIIVDSLDLYLSPAHRPIFAENKYYFWHSIYKVAIYILNLMPNYTFIA
jgi:hypothetical protein